MQTRQYLWGVIVGGSITILMLLFFIWWLFLRVNYVVYSQDTIIEGDLLVTKEQPIMLKDNAKLTVTGNALFEGDLVCKDGGLQLEVMGTLTSDAMMKCDTDVDESGVNASGVSIVAANGLVLGPDSVIESQGSVQLVDNASKLAMSQDAVDKVFDQVETAEQTGLQIGPLTNDLADQAFEAPKTASAPLPFVQVAHAQESDGTVDLIDLIGQLIEAGLTEEQIQDAFKILGSLLKAQDQDGVLKGNEFPEIGKDSDGDSGQQSDLFKKLFPGLQVTKQQAKAISDTIDEFLKAETKKWPVIVSGTIRIGSAQRPPNEIDVEKIFEELLQRGEKPKKAILNFDFSDSRGGATLSNLTIRGPHGSDAANGLSSDCTVVGDNGGNALRFNARAHNLRVNNLVLEMGSGGAGGTVANSDLCENASVTGGNGGKPGNIRMHATGRFEIVGGLTIIPGEGGQGGLARSKTVKQAEACPGKQGGSSTAIGGRGGDSMQRLKLRGSVGGAANIMITAAHGGDGGDAFAEANTGGNGNACGCLAGKGGTAKATGGNGGDAAPSANGLSTGGDGGDAIAKAGNGGDGGSCKKDEGPAGAGGPGGDATMSPGFGGSGDIAGNIGGPKSEALAGNGGDGGDGCPEGSKGAAGTIGKGGKDGSDGKRMCSTKQPEEKTLISLAGQDESSMYEIEVIPFQGSGIVMKDVSVAGPDECDSDHYHIGTVTMINGSIVSDPASNGCGIGKLSEVSPVWVPVNHETMKELYGAGIEDYLRPRSSGEQANTGTQVRIDGGIAGGEVLSEPEDPYAGCSMVELCQVGFGSWDVCPGQEDILARNDELGCPS